MYYITFPLVLFNNKHKYGRISSQKNRHGEVIHSDKRQCIVNMFKNVKTENKGILKDDAVGKVASVSGVSSQVYTRF